MTFKVIQGYRQCRCVEAKPVRILPKMWSKNPEIIRY